MQARWSEKFELKPGRWVFVPTDESRQKGTVIKNEILKFWAPPDYMYQFRSGGHVAALQAHLEGNWFIRVDLRDCFGSINRTRVTRCLKRLFGYALAREWANASVVRLPNESRWFLPFGFVQSPVIAALCLTQSALGSFLQSLNKEKAIIATTYVDDIIISTKIEDRAFTVFNELMTAVNRARFEVNYSKTSGPSTSITVFNLDLNHGTIAVSNDRMQRFVDAIVSTTSEFRKAGIRGYVESVNPDQVACLY